MRLLAVVAVVLIGSGCTGEQATPIDPANPPDITSPGDLTDVSHEIQPTDQMRDAAEQQCLDDPDLDEGYVQAVDPEDDRILAEIAVVCREVREG